MVMASNVEGFLKNLAVIQYGLMSTVYALGYLGLLAIIPMQYNPKGGAIGLLFFILVFTVSNDFIQMFSGKLFGKHKIIPKVSPNKTWEGLIGGVIGSTLLAVIMGVLLTPFSVPQLVFAGIVLSIFGFFGDVTMSAIKRDLGVKDTSTLIPGHGGILDRLDSLLFTAPLFFHYFAYTYSIVFTRG
jgi:phosphatidate cytidylyltransferase